MLFADPTVVLLLFNTIFNTVQTSVPNVHLPYAPARSTLVMRVGAVFSRCCNIYAYAPASGTGPPVRACSSSSPDGVAQLIGAAADVRAGGGSSEDQAEIACY